MSKGIECHFDFGSPRSYRAQSSLKKLAADTQATIVYMPIKVLEAPNKAVEEEGLLGVPAFRVREQLLFHNDRLMFAEAAAKAQAVETQLKVQG
ncbi:MAG: hypothetical protein KGZ91_00235 [Afipia sp.]|nr:hypothetical protein [Afipia sp.]